MKNTMLAIAAMALAALAPSAMAAEGDSDRDPNAGVSQPTMRDLANKIDHVVRRLGTLTATVSTATDVDALTTEVRTLSSTVSANHTTIVGKFAPQMAVVMTVPSGTPVTAGYFADFYLVGESTIPGFPAGTVAANGQFTDRTLPAGTYLFELQQPYGDNAICQRSVSVRWQRNGRHTTRRGAVCPRLHMTTVSGGDFIRFNNGFGIATYTAPTVFHARHSFPTGFAATDDKPLASYTGAIKITKLK